MIKVHKWTLDFPDATTTPSYIYVLAPSEAECLMGILNYSTSNYRCKW